YIGDEHIMIKMLLCKIGIHLMENHTVKFADNVSGETLFNATCACGKKWMTYSSSPIPLLKVEKIDIKNLPGH
ncbi:MAG: hypothetical protein U9P70_03755, partial [Patescibacteria group bacterium]|nr:hypothetical protein [Patescibacteria group bacterium]